MRRGREKRCTGGHLAVVAVPYGHPLQVQLHNPSFGVPSVRPRVQGGCQCSR